MRISDWSSDVCSSDLLRGKISDSWNWEASFGYGQYKQNQWRRNEINGMNLTQALNAEMGPNGPQCVDADARAAGCVAIDLFGAGSITPDMAAWIRDDLHQELTIRDRMRTRLKSSH